MTDQDSLQKRLYSQLRELSSKFEIAVKEFEAGQLRDAIETCARSTELARSIVKDLSTNYAESFRERVGDIEKIAGEFSKLTEDSQKKLDGESCLESVLKYEKLIAGLTREIHFQYRKQVLVPIIMKYWRPASAVLIGALVLIGLVKSVAAFRMRRYGLTGTYFAGMEFERRLKTRVDHQIKFDWGRNAPMFGVPRDHFSVHWDGFLRVSRPGRYELYVGSDDGSRLWIDDKKLVEDWQTQRYTVNRATVDLTSGIHKIQVDYFENGNTARVELGWRYENERNAGPIPYENLVPSEKYLEGH